MPQQQGRDRFGRFHPDGGIGEVKLARGLCYKRRKSIGPLGDYPIPEEVDFNLWSGPAQYTQPQLTRQRFHYDWHWQRHYGNGDSGNQGPHQTDVARWGLGLERHPESILTYAGRLGYQAERKDPDYVDAGDTANTQVSIYDYGDKTIVFETRGLSVDNSGDQEINQLFGSNKGNKIGVIFYGTEGYAIQGPNYENGTVYDKNKKLVREFKHNSKVDGELNHVHMSNFIDAVVSRDASKLNADAMCGHLSASIAHLGNTGYYVGQQNHVSPDEIAAAVEAFGSSDDDSATLRRTLQHLRDTFDEGSVIFVEGGPARMSYLILEGDIALTLRTQEHGSKIIQTLHRGDFLGWSWMYPPYRWNFKSELSKRRGKAIQFDGPALRKGSHWPTRNSGTR